MQNFGTDIHKKLISAYDLLSQASLSVGTFESLRTVLKGIHPEIDKKLEICSMDLGKLNKLQSGDVISLTVEGLPEDTEEKKKRKKALLLFINSLKNLQSEVKRVEKEFSSQKSASRQTDQIKSWGRIIGHAKGPLGFVTLAAIVIVGVILITHTNKSSTKTPVAVPTKSLVKIIMFDGKQIPISQLYIGQGPDCAGGGVPHYHASAKDGNVSATDGTKIQDPEGCGFGKVKDTRVIEVTQ